MEDSKQQLNSIHFVFQFLKGHGRDKLFKRCFNSWLSSFRPEDSIVVITSNGNTTNFPIASNITYINCSSILLAANKRNIGISLSDKKWTILIDDDILLKDSMWRQKLEAMLVHTKTQEAFYSLAPVVPTHKAFHSVEVGSSKWCYMERMGFNCVLAKTVIWKALPHLNWAFSADKTYLDYITQMTRIKLYRHSKGLVDHMVTDRMKTHFIKEKFRMIKEHKQEWFSQMSSQIDEMRKLLTTYLY